MIQIRTRYSSLADLPAFPPFLQCMRESYHSLFFNFFELSMAFLKQSSSECLYAIGLGLTSNFSRFDSLTYFFRFRLLLFFLFGVVYLLSLFSLFSGKIVCECINHISCIASVSSHFLMPCSTSTPNIS